MAVEGVLEVGVAVKDLDEAMKRFVDVLGVTPGRTDIYDRYGMRFNLCSLGGVYFEFIESITSDGAMARSVERRGEGVHHIALKVTDLDETMEQWRRLGIRFTEEEPLYLDVSYGRVKFTFAHPASLHGVLIELIEIL